MKPAATETDVNDCNLAAEVNESMADSTALLHSNGSANVAWPAENVLSETAIAPAADKSQGAGLSATSLPESGAT
eukprot:scaffold647804_cov46-Prasinocladus_malaysianus.AAC.1